MEEEIDQFMNVALSELKISERVRVQDHTDTSTAHDPEESELKLEETVRNLLNNIKPEEAEGDADFSKLDDVMEELLGELICKELLAEPFAELAKKFPQWAAEHVATNPHDQEKLFRQRDIIIEINDLFKDPAYSKEEVERKKKIFSLLQELQELGPIPEGLMVEAGFMDNTQKGDDNIQDRLIPLIGSGHTRRRNNMSETSSSDTSTDDEILEQPVYELGEDGEELQDEPPIDLDAEFMDIPHQFPSDSGLQPLGTIHTILLPFLVVKPHSSIAVLDIGSLVGTRGSQEVWEVLGPVKEPLYSVILRSKFHDSFQRGEAVFFSPSSSKLVSKDQLLQEKGIDVGPQDPIEFSDDEEEMQHRGRKTEEHGELP